MRRLCEAGLTIKREKCSFMQVSKEYFDFVIDETERHVSKEKSPAITEMPPPNNVSRLNSFIGMTQHNAKFLLNLSEDCAVFHASVRKDTSWNWSLACQKQFENVKKKLADSTHLVHFDPKLPVAVASEALLYGIAR